MNLKIRHHLHNLEMYDERHNKVAVVKGHVRLNCPWTPEEEGNSLTAKREGNGYVLSNGTGEIATATLHYISDGEMFPPRIDSINVSTQAGNYSLNSIHGKYTAMHDGHSVGTVSIDPLGVDKCSFSDEVSLNTAVAMYIFACFAMQDNMYEV